MDDNTVDGTSIKGSDPLNESARGKLQSRRSKINDEICRELKMRAGAENLYRAASNRKMKETVALELQFVNSNLQLLKEELSELNSSVDIYQNDSSSVTVPMIPLGLKETNDVHFAAPFKDYIIDHYSEDPERFRSAINDLDDLRQSARTPSRDEAGIDLLLEYYNQLYFVEKRLFPSNKSTSSIYFHWYDSLTGVPSSQRTVGFEKGSILFNIGSLYTQMGCRQDRSTLEGVEAAIGNFQKAAGAFYYLQDRFSHAPSMDMQPQTLIMLVQLMMSQAQECTYEKQLLHGLDSSVKGYLDIAQESAQIARMYRETHKMMTCSPLQDYVPFSWVSMVLVKEEHFSALSHYYTALALIENRDSDFDVLEKIFTNFYVDAEMNTVPSDVPQNTEERRTLGKSHMREALLLHEDAMRVHNLCKQLRKIDTCQEVLKEAHDRSLLKFESLESEDDFTEDKSVLSLKPFTNHLLQIIQPDLAKYKVEDFFHDLGPIAIFSARHQWSSPRVIQLTKNDNQGFGFSVRGDAPVIIAIVEPASRAEDCGMKVGDFLVGVNDHDTKWCKHEQIVKLIRSSGNQLKLRLITPLNKDYLKPKLSSSTLNGEPTQTSMVTPTGSTTSGRGPKTRSKLSEWMFKKRDSGKSRSRSKSESDTSNRIIR